MRYELKISERVDEQEWNNALLQNSNSMTYQTTNWQLTFNQVYGSKPVFVLITDSKGKIVGQLAGVIHRKWFWRDANVISRIIGNKLGLGTLFHWFYGPIIHDKNNQDEIISLILSGVEQVVAKNDVVMIRGITSPLEQDLSLTSFQKHGYELQTGATFIIDLTIGIENLYNSLKKDIRYYIRKSEKLGLEFEVVKSRKPLSEFQNLKLDAFKLEGRRPSGNPEKFFDKHWELLHKEGYEQLLVTRHRGENVGGILTLLFNNNVIQHALVNSPKMDLVGTFLTWNTIKWAIEKNYRTFDFAGVNPHPKTDKEKGIYYYASKFGGQLYEYTICTKIVNPTKFKLSSGLKNPNKLKNFLKTMKESEI